MKARVITLLAVIATALAACENVNAPQPAALLADNSKPSLTTTSTCQDGWQYMDATPLAAVKTDSAVIAKNCGPETCGTPLGGSPLPIEVDVDGTLFDRLRVNCGNGIIATVRSDSGTGCWDCQEGCAGSKCPAGAMCFPIPGLYKSDCVPFTCPAGWEIHPGPVLQAPKCKRPCPPPLTVTISGPAKIKPGAQCTWTATASGGSGSYSYYWYYDNFPQGTGPTYTGGRQSGTIYPQFTLRVDVGDGSGQTSASILVKEDPTARICTN